MKSTDEKILHQADVRDCKAYWNVLGSPFKCSYWNFGTLQHPFGDCCYDELFFSESMESMAPPPWALHVLWNWWNFLGVDCWLLKSGDHHLEFIKPCKSCYKISSINSVMAFISYDTLLKMLFQYGCSLRLLSMHRMHHPIPIPQAHAQTVCRVFFGRRCGLQCPWTAHWQWGCA